MATMPQFTPEQLQATKTFFDTNPSPAQIIETAAANKLTPQQLASAWSQSTGGDYNAGLQAVNDYLGANPNLTLPGYTPPPAAVTPTPVTPAPVTPAPGMLTPPPATTVPTFTPTPIPGSGSYNTQDWLSLLGGGAAGGVTGALTAAGINESVGRLQSLGETGLTDYLNLGTAAAKNIQFNPYTITSSLGTTKVGPDGSIASTLTPEMQANVGAATKAQGGLYDFSGLPNTTGLTTGALTGAQTQLGQVGAGQEDLAALRAGYGTAAQGMTGMLGGSTTDMANQLFQQQQAMRQPVQDRQAQELQNRMLAQGRLGIQTAAYGGTSEQLARNKAVQEQQAADAFNSMTQAEQMATSQQARALGLGSATSSLAQAQQALAQGDIAKAQGLFNLGSASANLPVDLQGKQVSQAGMLQTQALAPATAQLQQLQASGTLGKQAADTAYQQGSLFANTVGAGLQERLTAESAAAATRTKQYDSILKAVNTGSNPSSVAADLLGQGIKKVGDVLLDAAGNVLGKAVDILGEAGSAVWDSISNIFDTDAQFDKDFASALAGELTSDDDNAILDAWNEVQDWDWDWLKP